MMELADQASKLLGIQLTSAQLTLFETYERELIDWNTRYNLTAIDDPKKIRIKHFLDSLSCLLAMRDSPTRRVIDVGTGAGFPGIPLKIISPAMQLTLVESVGKKANFCRYIVETFGLDDVQVIQDRVEAVGCRPDQRQKYDWALARAVASLPVLVEYLLPLVRVGGYCLAMKGESGPAEAHTAELAIQLLGGQLDKLVPVTLPGVEDERFLVVISKTSSTPDRYPRRVGVPSKKPLLAESSTPG